MDIVACHLCFHKILCTSSRNFRQKITHKFRVLAFYKYVKLNAWNFFFFAKFHSVRKNEVIETAKVSVDKERGLVIFIYPSNTFQNI